MSPCCFKIYYLVEKVDRFFVPIFKSLTEYISPYNVHFMNTIEKLLIYVTVLFFASCAPFQGLTRNELESDIRLDLLEDEIDSALLTGNSVKILHITDLHIHRETLITSRAIAMITKVSPDILVMTGDMFEERDEMPLLEQFLSELPPIEYIYSITGNHEKMNSIPSTEIRQLYADYNIILLQDEIIEFEVKGLGFNLMGIDDREELGEGFGAFQIDSGRMNIVLAHRPAFFDLLSEAYPDSGLLCFSGHTHGGQINICGAPFFSLPPGSGRFQSGKYEAKSNSLYLSKGLGSGVDLRVGARRDMILVTIN